MSREKVDSRKKIDLKSLEMDPKELGNLTLNEVRCRACSGYGNCGYRSYRLLDGKPVLLCSRLLEELLAKSDETVS